MPQSQMPHDAAYKSFFSDRTFVTSLFQDFVPEDFVRDMDFTTLELLSANHVTKELRQRYNDIMEDSTMFEETCGRLADSWLQKGVIQGRAEGWEVGKAERTREVAQNLLHLGLSIAQIAEATGLSTVEIEALRKVQ